MTLNDPSPAPGAPPEPDGAPPVTAVLLDLDGTITDSAPIIVECFRLALVDLGLEAPGPEELMALVGPPLNEGFRLCAGLEGEANARAVARYREHYRTRMHRAPVYDGVPGLVRRLRADGVPLGLATSKREDLAVQILARKGLDGFFTVFSGADPSGRRSAAKADVIRRAVARLGAAGADTGRVVHVGDRVHDVVGAHDAGAECVGALWGYADADELADADWLAASPAEAARLLGSLTRRRAGSADGGRP